MSSAVRGMVGCSTCWFMQRTRSVQKTVEDFGEHRQLLEAHTGLARKRGRAVFDRHVRGELSEQGRSVHRDLGEAQAEARDRVHRKEMSGMRRATVAVPAVLVEVAEDAQVFD